MRPREAHVPLSDHEQRLLEQIEQAFYAEDPKFANAYRTTDLRTLQRRRMIRAGVLLAIAVGVAVAGAVLEIVPMMAGGGAVALIALGLAVGIWRRYRPVREPKPVPTASYHHGSWRHRLEERWERRWEDRGR
jgi:hypothetical protein